jgi:FAD/FMN-containing dehydrogenase
VSVAENVVRRPEAYDRLVALLGDGNVLGPGGISVQYSVAGHEPLAVAFPSSVEEIVAVVRLAGELSQPVVTWGAGTHQEVGPPLARPGIVLSMERMRAVLDLDIGNLTAEVQAGLPNLDLQAQLGAEKLFFPIDPPDRDRSTIGGNLATNASGPSRLRYRTIRDHLMGVSVVLSTGEVARFGGKTVKNVAGYDLRKVMIGSFGTLGIVTSAIVRLWPQPEVSRTLVACLPTGDAFSEFSRKLLGSYLSPTSFEMLDSRAAARVAPDLGVSVADGDVLCLVCCDGFQDGVDRHVREITEMFASVSAREVECLGGDAEAKLWERRLSVERSLAEGKAGIIVGRASVPLTSVGDLCALFGEVGTASGMTVASAAHAGNGVVGVYVPLDDLGDSTLASAAGLAAGLRRGVARLGGFFVVEKAPAALRRETTIWPKRSDYGLMKSVKSRFDPNGLLNPGRGVDGACEDA